MLSLEPECLQCSSVVEDKVYVIAEEGAEGDREHGGDEEEEEDVELPMSLTCSHISPELEYAIGDLNLKSNKNIDKYDEIRNTLTGEVISSSFHDVRAQFSERTQFQFEILHHEQVNAEYCTKRKINIKTERGGGIGTNTQI